MFSSTPTEIGSCASAVFALLHRSDRTIPCDSTLSDIEADVDDGLLGVSAGMYAWVTGIRVLLVMGAVGGDDARESSFESKAQRRSCDYYRSYLLTDSLNFTLQNNRPTRWHIDSFPDLPLPPPIPLVPSYAEVSQADICCRKSRHSLQTRSVASTTPSALVRGRDGRVSQGRISAPSRKASPKRDAQVSAVSNCVASSRSASSRSTHWADRLRAPRGDSCKGAFSRPRESL